MGYWGWQEHAISDGQGIERFDTSLAPMSTALGVLGMPGMTAYFGLLEIGKPKPGETVFVSGAAGAVGSLVGQIAKIKGCRVVGSAGSQQKVDYLTSELGFDAAFNYKEVKDYAAKLQEVCPQRDRRLLRQRGRPADRRRVHPDQRGGTDRRLRPDRPVQRHPAATRPEAALALDRQAGSRRGFLVFQFARRFREGQQQVAQWIKEGKVKYRETIVDGLERTPEAFIGLFHGENIGQAVGAGGQGVVD